ncbi:hypothetical protein PT974_00797 [Cladobotryum mycophilum]|uniref:Uncharacterized protein n=1 Tax=Cladobotryum mycophilum TaxID=491253 RepID=A0ABR0T223_9HYPO
MSQQLKLPSHCDIGLVQILERSMRLKQQPCFSEELLVGPSKTDWEQFRRPLLRKCPFNLVDTKGRWKFLDDGMDGCAWRFRTSDRDEYAIKMFWDNEPPRMNYWGFHRECQNAAILQAIEAAAEKATDEAGIWIHGDPKEREDAIENLIAFSDQGRRKQVLRKVPGVIPLTAASIPRFKKCFGWVKLSCKEVVQLSGDRYPPWTRVGKYERGMEEGKEYYGIVYEFIPEGENSIEPIQTQMDFFKRAGFDFGGSPRHQNWKSSMLVDYSELVTPWGDGWTRNSYRRDREARRQLNLDLFEPPVKPSEESDSQDAESVESDEDEK